MSGGSRRQCALPHNEYNETELFPGQGFSKILEIAAWRRGMESLQRANYGQAKRASCCRQHQHACPTRNNLQKKLTRERSPIVVFVGATNFRLGGLANMDNTEKPEGRAFDALWKRIEQRLPKCVRENPKTERRVGFLLGLGAGHFASQIVRKLLGGRDDEA